MSAEIFDFQAEKEKREGVKLIDELYAHADEVLEELRSTEELDKIYEQINAYNGINQLESSVGFYIDSEGNVVYYDAEGNKYIHTPKDEL